MTRTQRLQALAGLAGLAAVAALAVSPGAGSLIVLAAAVVAGELVELRPVNRAPLPLSLAFVVVLLRATSSLQFAVVVSAAFLVAAMVRPAPQGILDRAQLFAQRVSGAFLAAIAYEGILDSLAGINQRATVLVALAGATLVQLAIHDVMAVMHEGRLSASTGSGADIALVTSSILMAVGYHGIGGDGQLGLWGVLLFSFLLLAAWYSVELVSSTQRNFRQTVRALGTAPELGGLVRPGHVERVAELAVAMGHELDLSVTELGQLETAALLHHLGAVCLDERALTENEPLAIAKAGAEMLRASEALAPAGDIVAAEPLLHRPRPESGDAPAPLTGQILKVASAFDELTEGDEQHAAWAVEALFTGPGYVYDGRVLDALERVVVRRGLLTV